MTTNTRTLWPALLVALGCGGNVTGEGAGAPQGSAPDLDASVPAVDAATASVDASQHAGHSGTMPGAMGTPVGVKLPVGSPGVSIMEIRRTGERPVPSDGGAFRTSCLFSHMNYDDPIVFPGQPFRSHLHAYFGNTAADASSTALSLRTTGNSTCRGGIANRTAYWVPAMLDKNGVPVPPHSAQIYYKTGDRGVEPDAVRVFPEGLRMIAGDPTASRPGQENGYWSCETYNGHPNAIPNCPAGERVIMMVQFPQCWNGKDLDSSDHRSHMAYPINDACPASHPVAIPEITFNVYYDVPAGTRSSEWRLASDLYDPALPGGYSAHGDWFEGWDRKIAETFVEACDRASMDCHSHLLGDGRMLFNSLEPDDEE